MYKCLKCFIISEDKVCTLCGETGEIMCSNDHVCTCALEVTPGMQTCKICGKPVCPCGAHNVLVWSRVTGYLQDVSGWNSAKRQELVDRQRYDALTGKQEYK